MHSSSLTDFHYDNDSRFVLTGFDWSTKQVLYSRTCYSFSGLHGPQSRLNRPSPHHRRKLLKLNIVIFDNKTPHLKPGQDGALTPGGELMTFDPWEEGPEVKGQ